MERGSVFLPALEKNHGWDSGCPRSCGQLRVRLESRLRDWTDGPRVSVARSRFFVAAKIKENNHEKPASQNHRLDPIEISQESRDLDAG
jgi:hypothetical protein